MLPSDPSLVIATGIFLDLVQDHLKRKSKEEVATRFWVEWLAWGAIFLAVYSNNSLFHKFALSSSANVHLEEAIIEEKTRPPSNYIWITRLLSLCLVGAGFLSDSEHDERDWLLVGLSQCSH